MFSSSSNSKLRTKHEPSDCDITFTNMIHQFVSIVEDKVFHENALNQSYLVEL